jgi:hypothetical protein
MMSVSFETLVRILDKFGVSIFVGGTSLRPTSLKACIKWPLLVEDC